MADHPEAKQSTTGDRTSALVAGGLALLAAVGVVTIFSETIAAAWSPPATTSAAAAERPAPAPPPPSPAPGAQTPTGSAVADGGAAPP
jgi:hypothetical protein